MDTVSAIAIAVAAGGAWMLLSGRLGKVPAAQAKKLVEEGALLVDVRTRGEFASGHVQGALNVPVDELSAVAPTLAEKHGRIVVYCQSGMRSARATRLLRAAGAKEVFDLGAMSRWPAG